LIASAASALSAFAVIMSTGMVASISLTDFQDVYAVDPGHVDVEKDHGRGLDVALLREVLVQDVDDVLLVIHQEDSPTRWLQWLR